MIRPARAAALVLAALAASPLTPSAFAPSAMAKDGEEKAPAEDLVPLDRFFAGKVVKVEKGRVELAYDFEDAGQLADFEPSLPFRAIRDMKHKLVGGALRLEGTGSLRHKAVFREECSISAVFRPVRNKDFGFAITEEHESEVYTLYCVYDRRFSATDNVDVPQNMIIKFLARDPKVNTDGRQDWRYCGSRGQKPEIKRGRRYRVLARRKGMRSRLEIDDWDSEGKETGRDLITQVAEIYGYECNVFVDEVVITGRLDPAFVKRHRLDLEPPEPPDDGDEEGLGIPADEAQRIRARIRDYPKDTKPLAMAKLLRDAKVPEKLREEAVLRLEVVGRKSIVPHLVAGLYAPDEPSRRFSFLAVKVLTGKTFGYRPDADETSRSRAVKRLNEHIRKKADEFR